MEAGKHIELSLGEEPGKFRLVLDGMVIAVNMPNHDQQQAGKPGKRAANTPIISISPATTGSLRETQDALPRPAELDYYRQVSHDIYEGLGKLAKDINLSIQDLSLTEIIQNSMRSPNEHLDQARDQVNDVLLMTEQATLSIMELVEQIREDCQTVQTKLQNLAAQSPEDTEEPAPEASDAPGDQDLWDRVLAQAEELDRWLRPGASEKSSPDAGAPNFSLAEVLQILLEFCTNEKVKQHLKAVQAKQDAIFQGTSAERALSLLVAGAPQEDGFYQLPVDQVLELLKSHCEDERVKELFAKMASSAEKLFPVAALPLEAQGVEEESADETAETQGNPNPEVESRWEELQKNLQLLAKHRQAAADRGAGPGPDKAAAEVKAVLGTVDHITGNLSRIIEALSFQDLSGQRLLKILKLLRELQIQVLSLLVAAGEKLRGKLDDQSLSPQDSDQAREELDRLLVSCASSDESSPALPQEQPLDQDAINDLLTTMGF